jgi:hypothetical protein
MYRQCIEYDIRGYLLISRVRSVATLGTAKDKDKFVLQIVLHISAYFS